MAEVSLVHPVTGATKTVPEEKAAALKGQGWVGNTAPTRRGKGPDAPPDIQRGRDRLAADAGRVSHVEPLAQRKPAPRKRAKAPEPVEEAGTSE